MTSKLNILLLTKLLVLLQFIKSQYLPQSSLYSSYFYGATGPLSPILPNYPSALPNVAFGVPSISPVQPLLKPNPAPKIAVPPVPPKIAVSPVPALPTASPQAAKVFYLPTPQASPKVTVLPADFNVSLLLESAGNLQALNLNLPLTPAAVLPEVIKELPTLIQETEPLVAQATSLPIDTGLIPPPPSIQPTHKNSRYDLELLDGFLSSFGF